MKTTSLTVKRIHYLFHTLEMFTIICTNFNPSSSSGENRCRWQLYVKGNSFEGYNFLTTVLQYLFNFNVVFGFIFGILHFEFSRQPFKLKTIVSLSLDWKQTFLFQILREKCLPQLGFEPQISCFLVRCSNH